MKKRVLSILLVISLLVSVLPVYSFAGNQVVMTAEEFIGYLQYVVNRGDSKYGSGDVYSIGKYDGSYIYFDCWGLGESIICTNGQIVYNRDPSKNPWNLWDTSCGCGSKSGDWLESQCQLSSNFSNIVPGEWLFKENSQGNCYHVGYYIGNGKVIESTSDGSYKTQVSSIDSNGYCGLSGRSSSWKWTYHGKVPWISYSGGGGSKMVTISLNANGGKLNDDPSFKLQYGEKCNLSQYSVSRDGYALQAWTLYRPADKKWFVFGVGWCTEAEISAKNYSKAIYSPNLSMELDASWFSGIDRDEVDSFTFYAVWRRDYTVSINANGGKQNVKSFSVRYNTNCVLSPEMVSRSGYVLKGWNLYRPADGTWFVPYHSWCTSDEIQENGYEKLLYSPNLTMNLGSSWFDWAQSGSITEFVFCAVWEKEYQINVDASGGTVKYNPANLTIGEVCNLSPQMVSRNGYTLKRWNLYRPADGKWFVAKIGWCTEAEISENGLSKGGYPVDLSMELDSTWFGNCDVPVSSFVFYAVWESNCINGHNYTTAVTPPTCTEQGYTTYTCSCGDTYKSDYTDPTGQHNYKNGKCSVCGADDPNYKPDTPAPSGNFFSQLLNSIRNIFRNMFSFLPFC